MPNNKAAKLKALLEASQPCFLMEAHNGISAKIVQEAGFDGIWASGLTVSASCGVRDNNELSWTQVLEQLDFMSSGTDLPILLDGDTGYGNFNNFRLLIRKLEDRQIAGVCIEDKLFPKTNSFIDGEKQALADIDEFAGKIKAGKDTQTNDSFCIVARTEAFIAGWGLEEALRRAEAYRQAGADALLIHSKISKPDEILAFMREWGQRCPVVIVPTKYYSTPTEVFSAAGVRAIIWANHLLRAAISAMQRTAKQIRADQSLINVEEHVAPLGEVFRLQGADELSVAEERYLPTSREQVQGLLLAASQGAQLGGFTTDIPKAMVEVAGEPILARSLKTMRQCGIRNISVVRGFRKEAIDCRGVNFIDNDQFQDTFEVHSLALGLKPLQGTTLVGYGDVIFNRSILLGLLDSRADFTVAVDSNWRKSANPARLADLVRCNRPYSLLDLDSPVKPQQMSSATPVAECDSSKVHGEWVGLLKLSPAGLKLLKHILSAAEQEGCLAKMRMSELFERVTKAGQEIAVVYCQGGWVDVDEVADLVTATGMVAR